MKRYVLTLLKNTRIFPILKRIKLWVDPRTKDMMRYYCQFIKSGDVCFDVGANNGNRTEIFLGLGAKVIAIEPQPVCIDILKKQFSDQKRCIIVQKAAAAKDGTGEIVISKNNSVISSMSREWLERGRFSKTESWDQKINITTTTLDTLIKQYGMPKFCKIDVEGYEKEVLKGLTQPITYISFEFTQEFFDTAIENMNYISSLSSDVEFNYSLAESHHLASKDWVPLHRLVTILKKVMVNKTDLWGDIYAHSKK